LKSNQPEVQRGAAAWFAENPPADEAPKAAAARGLARLLDGLSPEVNAEALRALQLWATKDCLPQLLAFAQREAARRPDHPGPGDEFLIDILARFPDESTAEAIAVQLKHNPLRDKARQALVKIGPAANKAVLQRLNPPDPAIHKQARQLAALLKIATEAQLAQTLADVADPRIPRSLAALNDLARFRRDEANRSKVAKVLNKPLLDSDPGIRTAAFTAVRAWGTKDNTSTLLKLFGDGQSDGPGRDPRIIEVLGMLKDPAAARALAQGLTHPRERPAVSKALKAIGPGAETAVIGYLQSPDPGARIEACRVLAEIGTEKSLAELAMVPTKSDYRTEFNFVQQANLAAQQIKTRK
jgi:HEAT repeat protein